MNKVDAGKLTIEAQDEIRRQAMNMCEETNLTWAQITKVVVIHIGTLYQ